MLVGIGSRELPEVLSVHYSEHHMLLYAPVKQEPLAPATERKELHMVTP